MADGVLGLGTGASSLNNELISNLKQAERVSTVEPIETSLENWDKEKESIDKIQEKVNSFLESVKVFDLFANAGENAFSQISANSSGDSVLFDAEDINLLKEGNTKVTINALAKRDILQSDIFNSDTKETYVFPEGSVFTTDDETFDVSGLSYEELVVKLDDSSNISASIENVGSDQYRLVIKSEDTGLTNAINISSNTTGLVFTNMQAASNMDATIDGINYNLPTNNFDLSNGLKITASKVDIDGSSSSISIAKDNSQIEAKFNTFVSEYNELVALVDTELYDADSNIDDKSALKSMMDNIKSKIFESYGTTSDGNGSYEKDKSIFNYGFNLSKDGSLSIDSTILNKMISDDFQGLKDLFVGTADTEARGLGTQLKEYIDFGINSSLGGILSTYEDHMDSRKTQLTENKEKAIESLDQKYKDLATQFASYGVAINSFESSFSALSMMISQSYSTS